MCLYLATLNIFDMNLRGDSYRTGARFQNAWCASLSGSVAEGSRASKTTTKLLQI